MKEERTKSLFMLIGSMLIFGTVGVFRRFIPLPSAMLACIRGLLGGIFLCAVILIKRRSLRFSFSKKQVLLLILGGAFLGANWILLFEAYNNTSVAVATLCYYAEPTIVILLSPLIFREKLTLKKSLCASVSLVGIALVSGVIGNGDQLAGNIKGIFFGLGAALLYSAVVIVNKKNPTDDSYGSTVIELFSAAFVLLPYVIIYEDFSRISLSPFALIMIVSVGILHTGVAYSLYFGSMRALPSQTVALMSYIDPVFALVLSAVFLKEPMTPLMLIGAVLIIGAAAFSETATKRK